MRQAFFKMSIGTLIFSILAGCGQRPSQKASGTLVYPTVSYLDIKLDASGHLPSNPYIMQFNRVKKEIVFCGVNHLTDYSDTLHPMYATITKKFFQVRPDIAINEGGDVSNKQYTSRGAALQRDGEIGLTKILCDSLRIKTLNGDPNAHYEFEALLKRYSKGEVLAYICTERFMWSMTGLAASDSLKLRKEYAGFIKDYIMKEGGLDLNQEEQSLDFYKQQYQQLLGRSFSLSELEPTNPFERNSRFQEIGRVSKEIRDQFLLRTVDSLLDTHDKIFIVFGGWHLLTCKPGLEAIIKKNRN